jgi:hypothetical protein
VHDFRPLQHLAHLFFQFGGQFTTSFQKPRGAGEQRDFVARISRSTGQYLPAVRCEFARQHVDAGAPNAGNIDLRLGDRSGEGEQFGGAVGGAACWRSRASSASS